MMESAMSMEDPFSGGDNGGDIGGAVSAAPETSHEPAGNQGGSVDDIESLLAEFETGRAKAPASDAPQAVAPTADTPIDTSGLSADELMRLELGAISNRSLLQSVLDHQITLQEQRHQQEQQRQEKADFEETVEAASDMLEGLSHLGDHKEYAKRWLLAEAQLNPQLLEAWQHRRDSPEHQRHAVSTLKRAFKQMQKSAARMPDPEATEDRAAVTAAVRGSSRSPQPERAPDYSRMTQNELDREWEKHGA